MGVGVRTLIWSITDKGSTLVLEDGMGFEVHVNTMEGFWSLLRSWLCDQIAAFLKINCRSI